MRLKSRLFLFVFFNDTATTEIYTLSLHDALPISCSHNPVFLLHYNPPADWRLPLMRNRRGLHPLLQKEAEPMMKPDRKSTRLNSSHVRISYAVFCLKKKKST